MGAVRFSWLLAPFLSLLLMVAAGRSQAESAVLTILRFGDRGPDVAALQQSLQAAGFSPGVVDGIFGPRTEAAVRQAQEALGVTVDGLAGPETLARLDDAAGPVQETVRLVVHKAEPASSSEAESVAAFAPEEPVQDVQQFALTFNGIPNADSLPELLALLKEYGMEATFFLHGETAEQSPEVVAKIVNAGHEVGSLGLADVDMTYMTEQMQTAQIRRSAHAIQKAAGVAPAFFRPPQGKFNGQLLQAAAAEGLQPVLWTNVAWAAAPDSPPERLSDQLLRSTYPGAVVMVHQDHPAILEAMRLLLPRLQAEGYQSVGLSQVVTLADLGQN